MDWNSATALTKRSRFSRRARAASLTDEASSTSIPQVSMIRRTSSSSGSPTSPRSRRSSDASSSNRSRASVGVGQVTGILQGVDQGDDVGRVGAGDRAGQLVVKVLERLPAGADVGQGGRTPPEQGQVTRADRPARPGEQGQQLGVRGQVVEERERGEHLCDLGQTQQPSEADDLDRYAGRGQGVEDVGGVVVVPHQDADLPPGRARGVYVADLARQP